MGLADNTALITSYLASFSTNVPEKVAAHVAPDFENVHLGILGGGCTGRDVYQQRLAKFLSEFQQISYTVLDTVAEGTNASARYTMAFTQDAKRFEVPGIMWFALCDGLIAKRIDCWDGLVYLRQRGATAQDIADIL